VSKMLANENEQSSPLVIPKCLYSYCRSEHLNAFLSIGELRIGTLYEFRDTEAHGNQIGDQEEGRLTRVENIAHARGSELSEFARRSINVADNVAESARFINVQVNRREHSLNYYIYCVSGSSSWADGQKMHTRYDARIVIEEPIGFFKAIARCMAERIKAQSYIVKVEYGDKTIDYRKSVHPVEIKSLEYAYQQEFRLVMEPASGDNQPVIIRCPLARQFCSGQRIDPSVSPTASEFVEEISRKAVGLQFHHGRSTRGRKKRSKPIRHKRK